MVGTGQPISTDLLRLWATQRPFQPEVLVISDERRSAVEFTLQLIKAQSLRAILLAPREKRPPKRRFPVTIDPDEILHHLIEGGNLGIMAGNVAILDFDRTDLLTDMFMKIGPIEATVRTGSGKIHCYVQAISDIPARIRFNGELVGEIQRGQNQYVVAPPSIHPSGGEYKWLTDISIVPDLPAEWKDYLFNEMTPDVPDYLQQYVGQGMPSPEVWDGPDAAELHLRAQRQPGFRQRSYGVKFQCPGCREEGHDKSRDNAFIAMDGRWGCALDTTHKHAIGVALGVFPKSEIEVEGYDSNMLKKLGLHL